MHPIARSLTLVSLIGAIAGCGIGGGGGGGGGGVTPPPNPTQGLVSLQPVAGASGSNDYAWSSTGRILTFRAEVQFGAAHTGNLSVPWEIHTGSATGPLVTSGTLTASDTGDGTHSFFDTPVKSVDLHSAPPGGTNIWIVLDPAHTVTAPAYQGSAYDFYRIEAATVPTTI